MFSVFLLFGLFVGGYSECTNEIRRSQWATRPPKHIEYQSRPAPLAIISHTSTPECLTLRDCQRRIDNMRAYHMDQRGWDDIGYNFLIGGDGYIYEGRGWHVIGAHTKHWNNGSIGIAFVGTFNNKLPNLAQLRAAQILLHCGEHEDELSHNYKLIGALQVRDTDSPGAMLYREIQKWSHWTPNPYRL